jgi:glutamate formiminotransferase/formiminotetrahydrofolate cyclodeaminase
MLTGLRLSDFVEAVAAKTPTPGSGSVSAAVGAMGAALGVMVARFSDAPELESALDEVKNGFLPLVEADAKAYGQVNAALALPKGTEPEKDRRQKALQNALMEASDVPLKGMILAVRGLQALRDLAPRCRRNLAGDLLGAAAFLQAASSGCGENVGANAARVLDRDRRSRLERERARIESEVEGLRSAVRRGVENPAPGKP